MTEFLGNKLMKHTFMELLFYKLMLSVGADTPLVLSPPLVLSHWNQGEFYCWLQMAKDWSLGELVGAIKCNRLNKWTVL